MSDDRRLVTPRDVAREVAAGRVLHVADVRGCGSAMCAVELARGSNATVLYVAASNDAAVAAAEDATFLAAEVGLERGVRLMLPAETTPYADVQPDRRNKMSRMATLHALAVGDRPVAVLVTTAAGWLRRVPSPQIVRAASTAWQPNADLDPRGAARDLMRAGYLRVPVVEDPGSFAVRGGLIDVWPAQLAFPVRVELYGDMVASLQRFDPDTQRTGGELPSLAIAPARDGALTEASSERASTVLRSLCDAANYPSRKTRALLEDMADGRVSFGSDAYLPAYYDLVPLWEYLADAATVVIDDPVSVVGAIREEYAGAERARGEREGAPSFPVESLYVGPEALERRIAAAPILATHAGVVVSSSPEEGLAALESPPPDVASLAFRDHSDLERDVKAARTAGGKGGALDPLVARLAVWSEEGMDVRVVARATTQADRLASLLAHRDVATRIEPVEASERADGVLRITVGALQRGLVAPSLRRVLLTEEEIFGHRAHRGRPRRRTARSALEDLRALTPGDHVVHVEHGIGRYVGLEKRPVAGGTLVDLVVVEYAGGDKLMLPIYRLNQIQKFAGDASPRIDRLGGQTFARTKSRVKRKVREMADELLRLYAERANVTKPPLDPPDDEYAAFEAAFPFEETPDQAAAIEEVSRDLESDRVMDRLVCGDVGFGKTEVALRAAFRVAMAGRQVAFLCPTTVLAQQHYLTFCRRLADYPISVRALSRFESRTEVSETLKGLRSGAVDIVIGTHRLLSKDVHLPNLGLVVVDEEQRFGVAHKERLKQLRTSVDVLTLTATPIPRTLQLAAGGLRDMSLIGTAPVDRRAIRTIVSRHDEALIQQAVERELSRGGQVFYVYNRVEGIAERAARLQELLPSVRIVVGHGQMRESALEKAMLDFVRGQYDILVATSIIESGLDIPRANTMIVDRADLFGLAQLYQLRGRVGRSRDRAYCYLLVPPPAELSSEARNRIEALERYTELGSGFQVASLDMELRGAGNLLGGEQSGTVASVGFELFCRMLEEATAELRGEVVVHEVDPEMSFDVEALLAEEYVPEVGVRLSLYKRFSSAADEEEVDRLAAEMEDRFGSPPPEARALVELMRLKTGLRRLRALGCEATSRAVTLRLREDTPLDAAAVSGLVARRKQAYQLTPDMRLIRRVTERESPPASGLELVARMLHELSDAGAAS